MRYEGGDVTLNKELGITLKQSEFPELANYVGDDLIVTDGTSLLGADDKAAIAAIVNAAQFFIQNPQIEHGDVTFGFLPDEEQGLRGAKALDISEIKADFAYCLDCCGIGELIYQNWNAGDAVVTFVGQSAHPMNAKGKLVNSLLLAHKFISMLPGGEAPEYTDGVEGYYWVKELSGNSAKTVLKLDVREFNEAKYAQRMAFLQDLADSFAKIYGAHRVQIGLKDRYKNVFNYLADGENSLPVVAAKQAYARLNIEPKVIPMRGGYDGAVISEKGVPCPNLFTGAHNFHSIYEYLPVKSLRAASDVVCEIVKIIAEK